MSWFFYAFFFAVSTSISSVIFKRLTKKIHHLSIALASLIFSIPFLFLIITSFYTIPRVDQFFWLGVFGSAFLNIFATIFTFTALKLTDVSILAPISAFNPVFTTLVAFLFLRETPTLQGIAGIILVGLGGYFLNISHFKNGILSPLKKLLSDKGVQLMFVTYLIWAITPLFEKMAINHTFPQTPPFASFAGSVLLVLGITPIALLKVKNAPVQIIAYWKIFILVGALGALGSTAAFTAFSLGLLGYVTAIFKTSMFFTIIFAHIFLKEKGVKDRLL